MADADQAVDQGRLPDAPEALVAIDQDDLGAETERGAEGFDVAVLGLDLDRPASKLPWLTQARHHVLLVPGEAALPKRILVSVQVGEPGKADVRFAERFAWQLGASATVMTVVPERQAKVPVHTGRFIESCERMLGARGVVTRSKVRNGSPVDEILAEMSEGEHDLLIVGAPLPETGADLLTGALGSLFRHQPQWPILIVRHQTGT